MEKKAQRGTGTTGSSPSSSDDGGRTGQGVGSHIPGTEAHREREYAQGSQGGQYGTSGTGAQPPPQWCLPASLMCCEGFVACISLCLYLLLKCTRLACLVAGCSCPVALQSAGPAELWPSMPHCAACPCLH